MQPTTAGLARAGVLDERVQTSAAPEYLAATGYSDADRYVEDRAVVDGGVTFRRATVSSAVKDEVRS